MKVRRVAQALGDYDDAASRRVPAVHATRERKWRLATTKAPSSLAPPYSTPSSPGLARLLDTPVNPPMKLVKEYKYPGGLRACFVFSSSHPRGVYGAIVLPQTASPWRISARQCPRISRSTSDRFFTTWKRSTTCCA